MMPVFHNNFDSKLEEIVWVARKVKKLIHDGVDPEEIAVIGRKHANLQEAVKVFHQMNIPMNYERRESVLEKTFIKQIINILKFIDSLNQSKDSEKQELLPEILSYPFWRLPNLIIYQISQTSSKERKSWLEVMEAFDDKEVNKIADFLRELAKLKVDCTAEQILDEIMGIAREVDLPDNEDEEDDLSEETKRVSYNPDKGILNVVEISDTDKKKCITKYISPYKWYYFDSNYGTDKSEYFTFLSGLKVFFSAIRRYKNKELLMVPDVLEFVELMEQNGFPLIDNSVFNQKKQTVCLLTAHKAKGLEFEHVFTIDCLERDWNGRGLSNKIGTPSNLSLLPKNENTNDALRLFYVAITRSKKYLYLTSYNTSEEGKSLEKLSFLEGIDLPAESDIEVPEQVESLQIWMKSSIQRKLTLEEKSFIKPILENYKLSVTHLNNFLDISQGGPQKFLEQNLLRFPQSKTPSARYGSAMHSALERFYRQFRAHNILPNLNFLLDAFEDALAVECLNRKDFDDYLNKGKLNLKAYFENKKELFRPQDYIEFDFNSQNVLIGEAKITGKIDKIRLMENKEFLVVDLKTGKAYDNWKTNSENEKIKLDRYKRQLVFYKVLVENSRDFAGRYRVNEGCLEFLEISNKDQEIKNLATGIDDFEAENLKKVITTVYKKIINFEFELKKDYTPNFQGMQDFIQDLIQE